MATIVKDIALTTAASEEKLPSPTTEEQPAAESNGNANGAADEGTKTDVVSNGGEAKKNGEPAANGAEKAEEKPAVEMRGADEWIKDPRLRRRRGDAATKRKSEAPVEESAEEETVAKMAKEEVKIEVVAEE